MIAYLLAALRPRGPYPVLALIGEQGTAKTTFIRLLRSLVDPSTVPSSALPFGGRDLFIAAHNAHIMAFENVSKLSNAMSDFLCRLATGGGVRTRTLFRDADETLLRATKPEGISNFITRADLMDRSIILAMEPLTDRKTEARCMQSSKGCGRACSARYSTTSSPASGNCPAPVSPICRGWRILRLGVWPAGSTASRKPIAAIVRPRSTSHWSMICSPARSGR